MKLYLVQHAEALVEDVDETRPLSDKGVQDAKAMAAFLRAGGLRVDEIVHSGKMRAAQTAELLAEGVWTGNAPTKLDGLKPNDSTDHLCNTVMAAGGDLMVVGHMPFVARAAARCLMGADNAGLIKFEPGSVLCLERQEEGGEYHWSLEWFVKPAMLGSA